jgi:hypothetical protein
MVSKNINTQRAVKCCWPRNLVYLGRRTGADYRFDRAKVQQGSLSSPNTLSKSKREEDPVHFFCSLFSLEQHANP